ncbi:MAG: penicillin-binding transpeptidase domain-containing protein [Desulfosalsimonadaceae bacterium]|nr:penicillin-binding transpeptidase domain-containing protein [Desulfosalsimonadaceae bacterium]
MFNSVRLKPRKSVQVNQWRSYQSGLNKKAATRRLYRLLPVYAGLACVIAFMIYGVSTLLNKTRTSPTQAYSVAVPDPIETFDKTTLQKIIRHNPWTNSADNDFELHTSGKTYQVHSSIDPSLQQFIVDRIDKKNSKHFGFIAMDPETGRILSMVSYDRNSQTANICLQPEFPAASIIKIVTAAAALEKCGFNADTPVTFNGNKYTLYKTQLKEQINKHTSQVSFEKAFACSINPVFGKIGVNQLGKSVLESYASAFGFNRMFDFEIPLPPSAFAISDEPYNCAEAACGFNRKTLISPLHGALIVASIINNGKLVEPTLIDAVKFSDDVVYQRNFHEVAEPVTPYTANALKKMMTATVASGTASKSFSGYKKDKILSELVIGGKTGSINNNAEHLKYDWFAGFAEGKNGSRKIVVCALVVHKDYIGTKSAQYARMAIKEYFENDDATAQIQPAQKAAAL